MAKVLVVFYSMYSHTYQLAESVADGARSVEGADVTLARVADLMDEDALKAAGAWDAQRVFQHLPIADPHTIDQYDAIIVGTPTRFGAACAQIRNFWDRTGKLWFEGKLIGKLGSVFCSTGTQHGGAETTITSMWSTFVHHGMVVTGLPYGEQRMMNMDEITGGGPNGATTMSGADGNRMPSDNELAIACSQGRHVAELALKLAG